MDFATLAKNRIVDELATVIQDEANANIILATLGFPQPRPQFPNDGNTLAYWTNVCTRIENGVLTSGTDLQPLVDLAADRYPSNPVFQNFCSPAAEPAPTAETPDSPSEATPPSESETDTDLVPPSEFVYVLVRGLGDLDQIIENARRLATELGFSEDSVQLEFSMAEGILLGLTGWNTEQADPLARQLEEALRNPEHRVSTGVSSFRHRDYLLSQLFVEGPDQARFEINDIRATTPVRDVAQGILSAGYSDQAFGIGGGKGREVVVDLKKPDGSTERLNPDKTLHEQNIKEGNTLDISPESTAGAINAVIRENALARVQKEVVAFAQSHPGFKLSANADQMPTEYMFQFKAPGFAPPTSTGGAPIPIEMHEVFLVLSADFPMKAPEAFWQNPFFHPNVDAESGLVCLGALNDHYKPGLHFGTLCQLLIDIAGFRNYTHKEGYNPIAQKWVLSDEGQSAIESRGGVSVLRKIIHKLHEPRPLHIKRSER